MIRNILTYTNVEFMWEDGDSARNSGFPVVSRLLFRTLAMSGMGAGRLSI